MKSFYGIFVALSAILILEASAVALNPRQQPQGSTTQFSSNLRDAQESEQESQAQPSVLQPNLQDGGSLRSFSASFDPNSHGSENGSEINRRKQLRLPAVSPASTRSTAMADTISSGQPESIVSSDTVIPKILHIPLGPGIRDQIIKLPISGEASKIRILHLSPPSAFTPDGVSGSSTDVLKSLARTTASNTRRVKNQDRPNNSADVLPIEHNPQRYDTNNKAAQATGTINGDQDTGYNNKMVHLDINAQNYGNQIVAPVTSNSDSKAFVNAVSSSGNVREANNGGKPYPEKYSSPSYNSVTLNDRDKTYEAAHAAVSVNHDEVNKGYFADDYPYSYENLDDKVGKPLWQDFDYQSVDHNSGIPYNLYYDIQRNSGNQNEVSHSSQPHPHNDNNPIDFNYAKPKSDNLIYYKNQNLSPKSIESIDNDYWEGPKQSKATIDSKTRFSGIHRIIPQNPYGYYIHPENAQSTNINEPNTYQANYYNIQYPYPNRHLDHEAFISNPSYKENIQTLSTDAPSDYLQNQNEAPKSPLSLGKDENDNEPLYSPTVSALNDFNNNRAGTGDILASVDENDQSTSVVIDKLNDHSKNDSNGSSETTFDSNTSSVPTNDVTKSIISSTESSQDMLLNDVTENSIHAGLKLDESLTKDNIYSSNYEVPGSHLNFNEFTIPYQSPLNFYNYNPFRYKYHIKPHQSHKTFVTKDSPNDSYGPASSEHIFKLPTLNGYHGVPPNLHHTYPKNTQTSYMNTPNYQYYIHGGHYPRLFATKQYPYYHGHADNVVSLHNSIYPGNSQPQSTDSPSDSSLLQNEASKIPISPGKDENDYEPLYSSNDSESNSPYKNPSSSDYISAPVVESEKSISPYDAQGSTDNMATSSLQTVSDSSVTSVPTSDIMEIPISTTKSSDEWLFNGATENPFGSDKSLTEYNRHQAAPNYFQTRYPSSYKYHSRAPPIYPTKDAPNDLHNPASGKLTFKMPIFEDFHGSPPNPHQNILLHPENSQSTNNQYHVYGGHHPRYFDSKEYPYLNGHANMLSTNGAYVPYPSYLRSNQPLSSRFTDSPSDSSRDQNETLENSLGSVKDENDIESSHNSTGSKSISLNNNPPDSNYTSALVNDNDQSTSLSINDLDDLTISEPSSSLEITTESPTTPVPIAPIDIRAKSSQSLTNDNLDDHANVNLASETNLNKITRSHQAAPNNIQKRYPFSYTYHSRPHSISSTKETAHKFHSPELIEQTLKLPAFNSFHGAPHNLQQVIPENKQSTSTNKQNYQHLINGWHYPRYLNKRYPYFSGITYKLPLNAALLPYSYYPKRIQSKSTDLQSASLQDKTGEQKNSIIPRKGENDFELSYSPSGSESNDINNYLPDSSFISAPVDIIKPSTSLIDHLHTQDEPNISLQITTDSYTTIVPTYDITESPISTTETNENTASENPIDTNPNSDEWLTDDSHYESSTSKLNRNEFTRTHQSIPNNHQKQYPFRQSDHINPLTSKYLSEDESPNESHAPASSDRTNKLPTSEGIHGAPSNIHDNISPGNLQPTNTNKQNYQHNFHERYYPRYIDKRQYPYINGIAYKLPSNTALPPHSYYPERIQPQSKNVQRSSLQDQTAAAKNKLSPGKYAFEPSYSLVSSESNGPNNNFAGSEYISSPADENEKTISPSSENAHDGTDNKPNSVLQTTTDSYTASVPIYDVTESQNSPIETSENLFIDASENPTDTNPKSIESLTNENLYDHDDESSSNKSNFNEFTLPHQVDPINIQKRYPFRYGYHTRPHLISPFKEKSPNDTSTSIERTFKLPTHEIIYVAPPNVHQFRGNTQSINTNKQNYQPLINGRHHPRYYYNLQHPYFNRNAYKPANEILSPNSYYHQNIQPQSIDLSNYSLGDQNKILQNQLALGKDEHNFKFPNSPTGLKNSPLGSGYNWARIDKNTQTTLPVQQKYSNRLPNHENSLKFHALHPDNSQSTHSATTVKSTIPSQPKSYTDGTGTQLNPTITTQDNSNDNTTGTKKTSNAAHDQTHISSNYQHSSLKNQPPKDYVYSGYRYADRNKSTGITLSNKASTNIQITNKKEDLNDESETLIDDFVTPTQYLSDDSESSNSFTKETSLSSNSKKKPLRFSSLFSSWYNDGVSTSTSPQSADEKNGAFNGANYNGAIKDSLDSRNLNWQILFGKVKSIGNGKGSLQQDSDKNKEESLIDEVSSSEWNKAQNSEVHSSKKISSKTLKSNSNSDYDASEDSYKAENDSFSSVLALLLKIIETIEKFLGGNDEDTG